MIIKATKNFKDKMCDYISSDTPCRITLSVPTRPNPERFAALGPLTGPTLVGTQTSARGRL